MLVVTNSWRMWMIGMLVSVGLFAVIYFTVIQPDNNAANQALKSGLQQSQQVLNNAQKQLKDATGQASSAARQAGTASTAATGVANSVQKTVNKAQKLAACVAAAGTDVSKVQACQAQFGG
jgi:type II secretory pathway component PulM